MHSPSISPGISSNLLILGFRGFWGASKGGKRRAFEFLDDFSGYIIVRQLLCAIYLPPDRLKLHQQTKRARAGKF
eukprot:1393870-Amorphochlora_amoeboformis.AAC.1